MKLAISSTGQGMDSQVDARFGRCPYFVVVDVEDKNINGSKAIANPNVDVGGGAGISAAQLVANEGVKAVIAVNIGPRAVGIFKQLGIDVYHGSQASVKENVDAFVQGKLKKLSAENSPMGAGMGAGTGQVMGRGQGMGRGFGRTQQ